MWGRDCLYRLIFEIIKLTKFKQLYLGNFKNFRRSCPLILLIRTPGTTIFQNMRRFDRESKSKKRTGSFDSDSIDLFLKEDVIFKSDDDFLLEFCKCTKFINNK